MAMGYWAILQPDLFTFVRAGSTACKQDPTCKERLQVFWHDWVYAGSQSSIAKVAQVAQSRSYMLNLTVRCLGLCQEEQTVLQLHALGVHLSALGWRNISIQRLPGKRAAPTSDRLVGGFRGPCSVERARLAKPPGVDAEEDVYAPPRPPSFE